jgi:hypothetical protein
MEAFACACMERRALLSSRSRGLGKGLATGVNDDRRINVETHAMGLACHFTKAS